MHKLHGGELETLILLPADHNTQCQFTSCPRKKLSVATQMSEVGTHTPPLLAPIPSSISTCHPNQPAAYDGELDHVILYSLLIRGFPLHFL